MIRLTHDGAVGVVTLSHPPHNLIGAEFIDRYCTAQEDASLSLARQLAAGPTVALRVIKRVVNIAVNEGTRAADEALSDELAAMWASNDVRRGTEAMFTGGPGTAVFEGN
ncbi:hypothetical protein [Candidatus Poriferisodalis sp.]|uniref:hypothetical protein n=1 Tax=Candidatus Poriferisodalis sp. TaxID=3101277 RepID=UPI003D0BF497